MNSARVRMRGLRICGVAGVVSGALLLNPAAPGAASGGVSSTGPATVPGQKAKLVDGRAIPPRAAPDRVKRAIRAANRIVQGKPYCYGGGHAQWRSPCYDCSGTVSYALGRPGARLIRAPMPSGSFMSWGRRGKGRWITVYANSGHMYAVIAGLRLDTSMTPGAGPGWSKEMRSARGFAVRHPRGL